MKILFKVVNATDYKEREISMRDRLETSHFSVFISLY